MIEQLERVTLKSGETMDVVMVQAPEPTMRPQILPFLGHKGEPWEIPMAEGLLEKLPGLEERFYLGVLNGEIVGNITTVEALERPVGCLQHVYTDPNHRRKGICQAVIRNLRDDFARRSGRYMGLGTGYDSPPYWIYHGIGFRGIGQTGLMEWRREEGFGERYFAPRPARARATQWGDWPLLECLYLQEAGWVLRSLRYGCWGRSSFEGNYVRMVQDTREGHVLGSTVLECEDGALVGHALCARDWSYLGHTYLLDFFIHPHFVEYGAALIEALPLPTGAKVQAHCDGRAAGKVAVLERCGFAEEARLRQQVRWEDEWLDVVVWAKV